MKIYLVYLKHGSRLSNQLLHPSVYFDKRYTNWFPYAYTKDIKMIKDFMEIRKEKFFKVKEIHIDKDEFDIIQKELTKILHYRISFNNTYCSIPVTFKELDYMDFNFSEELYEYLSKFVYVNPEIFNDKYKKELDKIGYIFDYYSFNGDESEVDYINYNASFFPSNSLTDLGKECSELFKYLIIFREVIDKDKMLIKFISESRRKT
jgi:hypothetical protein